MRDLFAHTENKYKVLNLSDFNLIFEKLDTVKMFQISTEYLKTKYLADALKHDPAVLYAVEIFYHSFPAIPDRTFEDLVEILTLHAPTFITANSTFGYSNVMPTTVSICTGRRTCTDHRQAPEGLSGT